MENPATLYGQVAADPYGPGHSAKHHQAHLQHHPGVHPPHDAPHHHLEVTSIQATYGIAQEAENDYMSLGRERKNSSSSGKGKSPAWMHPENLTAEERDKLLYQVPKDTIELLKEGHTEYIIK